MRVRLLIAVALFACANALAQSTVAVTVPSSVSFFVNDVGAPTAGTPNPAILSYLTAVVPVGQVLRFSVMADSATFNPPSGGTIPTSLVSWTTSNAIGGVGASGTLSHSVWSLVYQSTTLPTTGSVDLMFTLDAPGSSIRSGAHTLTMRWKIESVVP